ncbi:MAG: DUF2062 domain-containing protein [Chryseobacterium sp.]|nr:MAG: DUF2062 domain-containing protein [Chryseobacterium sp.]
MKILYFSLRIMPIKVYYAPKETRISHFRPFKDFSRISVLNTVLVFITFLYIKPRNFFRSIFRNRNWKQNLKEKLFDASESDALKAWSIGVGVFMGIVPLWGLQLIIAIALAFLFKLNKVLVVIAANISIPPMIPLVIFGSYQTGRWWMGDKAVDMPFSSKIDLETIKLNLLQYIYGSITLAILAGITFGLVTYIILKSSRRKANIKPV